MLTLASEDILWMADLSIGSVSDIQKAIKATGVRWRYLPS